MHRCIIFFRCTQLFVSSRYDEILQRVECMRIGLFSNARIIIQFCFRSNARSENMILAANRTEVSSNEVFEHSWIEKWPEDKGCKKRNYPAIRFNCQTKSVFLNGFSFRNFHSQTFFSNQEYSKIAISYNLVDFRPSVVVFIRFRWTSGPIVFYFSHHLISRPCIEPESDQR